MEPETKKIQDHIRSIPDWPKEGILFRDITPLLGDAKAFAEAIEAVCNLFEGIKIDYVAAVEARGFIFGASVAEKLESGFIPIRKAGKLPHEIESVTYDLEYGTDTLEVHKDALSNGKHVLMVDDLLATGGTMAAACELIEKIGGQVVGAAFLIELSELAGREKLSGYDVRALINY